MGSPWENILWAFQRANAAKYTTEFREEPASIEPGKTTSTPQKEPSRKSTRKVQKKPAQ